MTNGAIACGPRTSHIMLASGALFDFNDPAGSDFTIHDIAHGLARVCRFAGQSSRFYSVAEHCIHVARIVPVEHARAALLHDAAEAFLGDVTRPLKALLPDYKIIEARVEDAIAIRFLTDQLENSEAAVFAEPSLIFKNPLIKAADMAMCIAEAKKLMSENARFWADQSDDIKAKHPAEWERATNMRLNFDKPEFAASKWLEAWNRYSHWEQELPTNGEAS